MIPHDQPPELNADQRARAEAVRVARDVLAPTSVGGRGGVDMFDVMHLAEWIITGRDPFVTEDGGRKNAT